MMLGFQLTPNWNTRDDDAGRPPNGLHPRFVQQRMPERKQLRESLEAVRPPNGLHPIVEQC